MSSSASEYSQNTATCPDDHHRHPGASMLASHRLPQSPLWVGLLASTGVFLQFIFCSAGRVSLPILPHLFSRPSRQVCIRRPGAHPPCAPTLRTHPGRLAVAARGQADPMLRAIPSVLRTASYIPGPEPHASLPPPNTLSPPLCSEFTSSEEFPWPSFLVSAFLSYFFPSTKIFFLLDMGWVTLQAYGCVTNVEVYQPLLKSFCRAWSVVPRPSTRLPETEGGADHSSPLTSWFWWCCLGAPL